jgi:Mg-chelatase subunit ChlD
MNSLYSVDVFLHTAGKIEDLPFSIFQKEDTNMDKYSFGVFQIRTNQTAQSKTPIAVFFSVDDSGSMSDITADGRTKMQHIKHTLKRILQMFAEKSGEQDIYVAIESFDTEVKLLFDFVKIDASTLEQHLLKIETLYPRDMTNIEGALLSAKNSIEKYRILNPTHQITHIQLTDGCTNVGIRNPNILKQLVSNQYTNIFIGFGKSHDSHLLYTLSKSCKDAFVEDRNVANAKVTNEYRVIDKLENAGMVYGEIVHNLLYPAIWTPSIVAHSANVELYDFQTNQWVKTLHISNLSGTCEKNYHFRVLGSEHSIVLRGFVEKNGGLVAFEEEYEAMPDLIYCNNHPISELAGIRQTTDLTKYIYRQKTQELLFECREFNDSENWYSDKKCRKLKNELKEFYTIMKNSIEKNGEDLLMRELMDDIYISFKSLGKEPMLISARQTSQGRGDSYRVTSESVEDEDYHNTAYMPTLRRQQPIHIQSTLLNENDIYDTCFNQNYDEMENNNDDIFIQHHLLDNIENTSTQTQPDMIRLMRNLST